MEVVYSPIHVQDPHRVRYGGRKHPADGAYQINGSWRHEKTEHKRWTGSQWTNQETIGASLWRYTGSPNNLDFHTLGQDVNLTGGALVKQRLRFQCYDLLGNDWVAFSGRWNRHFLE